MIRRRWILWSLAGFLALLGLSAVVLQVWSQSTTLRLAVGPSTGEDYRLFSVLAQILNREGAPVRLKIVTADNPSDAAMALQRRTADLAVVRSDVGTPPDGLALAVVRRDSLMLIVTPQSPIASVADLAGKTIGLPRFGQANVRLMERILAFHAGNDAKATIIAIPAEDVGNALRDGRIDAVAFLAPVMSRPTTELMFAISTAIGAHPVLVPIEEAEALAGLGGAIEATEIPRGAFGGAPLRPVSAVQSVGVTFRLVGHRSLDEAIVSTFTQLLFTLRPALTAEVPFASRIEAPDINRGSAMPVHPGATAYFEGDIKTFFDRYGDWFYIVVMIAGLSGSLIAGIAGVAAGRSSRPAMRERDLELDQSIDAALALLLSIRRADSEDVLEEIEAELDRHVIRAVGLVGKIGGEGRAGAFQLAFEQVRARITERRALLQARAAAQGLRGAGHTT